MDVYIAETDGTELDINTDPYAVTSLEAPAPQVELALAGSIDTEGDLPAGRKWGNRRVSLTVEVVASTLAARDAAVAELQKVVAGIAANGGTLRKVSESGESRTADLLSVDGYDVPFDVAYEMGRVAVASISLPGKPFVRGDEVEVGGWHDDFSTDTITAGEYTFDASSSSQVVVSSGALRVP